MGGSFVVEDCPGVLWFFGSANTPCRVSRSANGLEIPHTLRAPDQSCTFMGSGKIDGKGKDQKENALYINFHTIVR